MSKERKESHSQEETLGSKEIKESQDDSMGVHNEIERIHCFGKTMGVKKNNFLLKTFKFERDSMKSFNCDNIRIL